MIVKLLFARFTVKHLTIKFKMIIHLLLIFFLLIITHFFIHGGLKRDRSTSVPALSKVWLINMNKRSSRLQTVVSRLKQLRIPYSRYGAINFDRGDPTNIKLAKRKLHPMTKINFTLVRDEITNIPRPDLNWGSTGCWQSHLQIYMQIVNGSAVGLPGPFLILEDDVNISSRIVEILSYEYLYQYLPYDWEMLYLDHMNLRCHTDEPWWKRPQDENRNRHFCLIRFTFLTDAYVIRNPAVAEKLVQAGNTPHAQVADWYLNQLFGNKTIRAYAILRKPVSQLKELFGTDIQESRVKKKRSKRSRDISIN